MGHRITIQFVTSFETNSEAKCDRFNDDHQTLFNFIPTKVKQERLHIYVQPNIECSLFT